VGLLSKKGKLSDNIAFTSRDYGVSDRMTQRIGMPSRVYFNLYFY